MTTKDTVLAAINKAAIQYRFNDGMIFHSDRGTQYASKATRNTLKSYNIVQSMSRTGNCWDNAVAESFFKSLKTELIYETKLVGAKQMKKKYLNTSKYGTESKEDIPIWLIKPLKNLITNI